MISRQLLIKSDKSHTMEESQSHKRGTNPSNMIPAIKFSDQDLNNIGLWKYFADRGDQYKEKLWSMSIWIIAGLAGLLTFWVDKMVTFPTQENKLTEIKISDSLFGIGLAAFGMIACFYSLVLISDYLEHIDRNWKRADYIKESVPEFDSIWQAANLTTKSEKGSKKLSLGIFLKTVIIIILVAFGFISFYGLIF